MFIYGGHAISPHLHVLTFAISISFWFVSPFLLQHMWHCTCKASQLAGFSYGGCWHFLSERALQKCQTFFFSYLFFSFLSSKHTAGLCRRQKLVMLVLVWD